MWVNVWLLDWVAGKDGVQVTVPLREVVALRETVGSWLRVWVEVNDRVWVELALRVGWPVRLAVVERVAVQVGDNTAKAAICDHWGQGKLSQLVVGTNPPSERLVRVGNCKTKQQTKSLLSPKTNQPKPATLIALHNERWENVG